MADNFIDIEEPKNNSFSNFVDNERFLFVDFLFRRLVVNDVEKLNKQLFERLSGSFVNLH